MTTTGLSLEALIAELRQDAGAAEGRGRGIPPVEKWNPEYCGVGGFDILTDGTWLHEGTRIARPQLVRLFSTILRKDLDGHTYLVTPGEKIRVAVADAPFLAIRVDRAGAGADQSIVFSTNVGDVVALGPDHPLRVTIDPVTREPRPYVHVRGRLEARILRAPFYELVDWAEERGGMLAVRSQGAWFELGAPA
jgi:uncharacterized protein